MPTQDKNLSPSRFQMGLIKRIGIDKYLTQIEEGRGKEITTFSNTEERFRQMENEVW